MRESQRALNHGASIAVFWKPLGGYATFTRGYHRGNVQESGFETKKVRQMPKTIKPGKDLPDQLEEDWPPIEIESVPAARATKSHLHKKGKHERQCERAEQVEEEWPAVEIQTI
jgi:hypothetical protein